MPLGYRSIFTVSGDQGATAVAADQFRSWLRQKGLDADATLPGLHEVGPNARLFVTELWAQDGSQTLRYRLTESEASGEWVTTLTAHGGGREPGWIWVDIDAPPLERAVGDPARDSDSGGADLTWTAVPRLVRNILSVTDASDGELALTERPRLVRVDEVDELIDTICDPTRRGAAVVAAPVPGVAAQVVISHVEKLTRHCVGLAGMYVLDDQAAKELAEQFEPLHAVPYGALRTYLPGADPASAVDARRHRIMLARTIVAEPTEKLARTLGWATRARSLNMPLPREIVRVDRRLSREEPAAVLRSFQKANGDRPLPSSSGLAEAQATAVANAGELSVVQEATEIAVQAAITAEAAARDASSVVDSPPVAPVEQAAASSVHDVAAALEPLANLIREFASGSSDQPTALETAELVSRLRQVELEGRQALRGQVELSRRVTELQDALYTAEDQRDEARRRLEDEQLEHAETVEELARARFEAHHFRAALAAAAAPPEAWVLDAQPPSPPGSFEELLSRLDEGILPGVVFTGDPSHALDLDIYDPLGTWAAKTWEMLRAIDGYVQICQAGQFSGGLHAYLSCTPPGLPGYPAGAHAAQESDSVEQSPRLRSPRELVVPSAVCIKGRIFMGAHFKIARRGTISPRMHYFDDAAKTGKVYVGYIGRHLPNTLTN